MTDVLNLLPATSGYLMVSGGILLNLFTFLSVKDEIVAYLNQRRWKKEQAEWEKSTSVEAAPNLPETVIEAVVTDVIETVSEKKKNKKNG